MPGYILVQLVGATLAALFLYSVIDVCASFGSNYPASGYSNMATFWIEFMLKFGLVSMNPVRTFGPDLVGTVWTAYWASVAGSGAPRAPPYRGRRPRKD